MINELILVGRLMPPLFWAGWSVMMTFLLNCPNKRIINNIITNLSVMDGIISVTQEK